MKNYQCRKCGTAIQSGSTPSSSGCPSGNAVMHSWTNLGETGNNNYQCKKCGTVLQSERTPSSSGCPSGSAAMHTWNKI